MLPKVDVLLFLPTDTDRPDADGPDKREYMMLPKGDVLLFFPKDTDRPDTSIKYLT